MPRRGRFMTVISLGRGATAGGMTATRVPVFPRRGLTLVEVLAVTILLGIAFSTLVVSLHGADVEGSILRVSHQWRELDREGRLTARSSDPLQERTIRLTVDDHPNRLVLCKDGDGTQREMMRSSKPHVGDGLAMSVRRLTGERMAGGVAFDGRGCSPTYLFEIAVGEADSAPRRWIAHGLTGAISEWKEGGPSDGQ